MTAKKETFLDGKKLRPRTGGPPRYRTRADAPDGGVEADGPAQQLPLSLDDTGPMGQTPEPRAQENESRAQENTGAARETGEAKKTATKTATPAKQKRAPKKALAGKRTPAPRGKTARPAGEIATPDGRKFRASAAASPLYHLTAVLKEIFRLVGRAIMTVWRLAGALDSALWRGLKLIVLSVWRIVGASCLYIIDVARDLVDWLPSRGGRAYTAFSGVVLIISSLWILDELQKAAELEFAEIGEQRPPVDLDDPILARMGGRYIRISDIEAAARASGRLGEDERLTPRAAFERGFVDAFVEQRLLAQRAVAQGIARDPAVSQRLLVARDRILAAAYLEREIAASTQDDTIAAFYASQADVTRLGDEVRAQHIVVETEAEAREILALLGAGEDFTRLARTRSVDRATAPLGGELGYFTKDMMTPALAEAAFRAAPGAPPSVFFSEFGWHVLRVLDRRPTDGVPLAAVEDRIRQFLTLRAIDQTVGSLKAEGEVVYYRPQDPAPDPDPDPAEVSDGNAARDPSG